MATGLRLLQLRHWKSSGTRAGRGSPNQTGFHGGSRGSQSEYRCSSVRSDMASFTKRTAWRVPGMLTHAKSQYAVTVRDYMMRLNFSTFLL